MSTEATFSSQNSMTMTSDSKPFAKNLNSENLDQSKIQDNGDMAKFRKRDFGKPI